MKPQGLLALTLSALVLSGCASAPETNRAMDRLKPATAEELQAKRQLLIGNWYGEAVTNEGLTRRWLRENHPEGTYKLTIRDYQLDASFVQQVEVGQWGVSGPVYFTIMKGWQQGQEFRSVSASNPYYQDAFEITKLTPDVWTYQHMETKLRFAVKRVEDDYTLPGKMPEPEKPAPASKASAPKAKPAAKPKKAASASKRKQ